MKIRRIYEKICKKITNKKVYVNVGQLPDFGVLSEKNIVITGGGSGIGAEIAVRCVQQNANVVICGRDREKLLRTKKRLEKSKNDNAPVIEAIEWDITDIDKAAEKVDMCVSILGKMDCFVNNAGIYLNGLDYETTQITDFDRLFSTNLKAPFFITKEVVRYMKDNNIEGNILAIVSETGLCAYTNPYALTKSALIQYAQGLAYELAEFNIRSNAIAPGITVSDINKRDIYGDLAAKTRNGRMLRPEEIAETALFLLSDASKCINGEVITCNGGNCLRVEYFR